MSESGEFGVGKNGFFGVWLKNFFYRTFQGIPRHAIGWHCVTALAERDLARNVRIEELTQIASLGTPVRRLWAFRDSCAHSDSPERLAVICKSYSIAIDVIRQHLVEKLAQLELKSKLSRRQFQDFRSFAPILTQNSPLYLWL